MPGHLSWVSFVPSRHRTEIQYLFSAEKPFSVQSGFFDSFLILCFARLYLFPGFYLYWSSFDVSVKGVSCDVVVLNRSHCLRSTPWFLLQRFHQLLAVTVRPSAPCAMPPMPGT